MNDRNNSKTGFLAGVIIAAIAVGTGSAWMAHNFLKGDSQSPSKTVSQLTPTVEATTKSPIPSPATDNANIEPFPAATPTETVQKPSTTEDVSVYWLGPQATQDLKLQPTKLNIATKSEPKEILETAFQELLSGQNDRGYTTTIPAGTKLLSLKTDKTGIHINLSGDFITGGGSASTIGRLGQVIYTATTLDPNSKVWIDVDGKPLEYLGGEGLEVSQPMTRSLFQENFLSSQ
jgi:spore germination protein GerM